MPNFRFITTQTALNPSDIHEVLNTQYRNQQRGTRPRFASIKTEDWAVGYPLTPHSDVRPRWFDKTDSPDQVFLPFEELQPVRMPHLRNRNGYTWRLTLERDDECLEADLEAMDPHESRNRILAIEVYRQEEIRRREEPSNPFVTDYPLPSASRRSEYSRRLPATSASLRARFEDQYTRDSILRLVEDATGMAAGSLTLLADTGEIIISRGPLAWYNRRIAYIDSCTTTVGTSHLRGYNDFSIHVRGANDVLLCRVPEERMASRSITGLT